MSRQRHVHHLSRYVTSANAQKLAHTAQKVAPTLKAIPPLAWIALALVFALLVGIGWFTGALPRAYQKAQGYLDSYVSAPAPTPENPYTPLPDSINGSGFTVHDSQVYSAPMVVVGDSPATAWQGAPSVLSAQERVSTLLVNDSAVHRSYDRQSFQSGGKEWNYDFNESGCNTRDDLLRAYLVDVQMRGSCTVTSGIYLYEPYTGTQNVSWSKSKASALQGEHVVALGNASDSGAELWGTPAGSHLDDLSLADDPSSRVSSDPATRKVQLANDPLNLILADGSANASKGDSPADVWLPENTAFHCEYVARQVLVKAKYGLSVTSAEKSTMEGILVSCPVS